MRTLYSLALSTLLLPLQSCLSADKISADAPWLLYQATCAAHATGAESVDLTIETTTGVDFTFEPAFAASEAAEASAGREGKTTLLFKLRPDGGDGSSSYEKQIRALAAALDRRDQKSDGMASVAGGAAFSIDQQTESFLEVIAKARQNSQGD